MKIAAARAGLLLCYMLAAAAPACAPHRPSVCVGASSQEPGKDVWALQFQGDGSAEGIAIDRTGHVAMIGSYRGAIDLHDGPRAVMDVDGNSDMFVAKLDAQGKVLWTRHFGGVRMQLGHDVAFDRDGNVIAVGEMSGEIDFGKGLLRAEAPPLHSAAVVVKLDPSGRTLWARLFENAARAESVVTDASGDAYVSMSIREGISVVKLDPVGDLVFDVRFENQYKLQAHNARMVADAQGRLVVAWNHIPYSYDVLHGQKRDMLEEPQRLPRIARLDEAGRVLWDHGLETGGLLRAVAVDAHSDILLVSHAGHAQTSAGFVSKLAKDGQHVWTKALGPGISPLGLAVDGYGNLWVSGMRENGEEVCGNLMTGPPQTAFLAKLSRGGSLVWARPIEQGAWGGGEDVAIDSAGAIVVAGFGATGPLRQKGPLAALHMFLAKSSR